MFMFILLAVSWQCWVTEGLESSQFNACACAYAIAQRPHLVARRDPDTSASVTGWSCQPGTFCINYAVYPVEHVGTRWKEGWVLGHPQRTVCAVYLGRYHSIPYVHGSPSKSPLCIEVAVFTVLPSCRSLLRCPTTLRLLCCCLHPHAHLLVCTQRHCYFADAAKSHPDECPQYISGTLPSGWKVSTLVPLPCFRTLLSLEA